MERTGRQTDEKGIKGWRSERKGECVKDRDLKKKRGPEHMRRRGWRAGVLRRRMQGGRRYLYAPVTAVDHFIGNRLTWELHLIALLMTFDYIVNVTQSFARELPCRLPG